MHHLFLGLPTRQLGVSPYVPSVSKALDVKAREVGLKLAPGAYIHLLPNIAGFVGGDYVAMLSPLSITRFKQVGNAAGVGAKMTWFSLKKRAKVRTIASQVNYIELAGVPGFSGVFSEATYLGRYTIADNNRKELDSGNHFIL